MSCNGCRVLRKGCSEGCILRPCLQWIEGAEAQSNATLFVAKFFGRADLMSFISAVPHHQRPALFQSLLFEACGRTVNPVNGAVGLLSSGNWHLCQAAVDTVLRGGVLRPFPPNFLERALMIATLPRSAAAFNSHSSAMNPYCPAVQIQLPYVINGAQAMDPAALMMRPWPNHQVGETTSLESEMSGMTTASLDNNEENDRDALSIGGQNRKLLNLFV